jgi:hypothetical protein
MPKDIDTAILYSRIFGPALDCLSETLTRASWPSMASKTLALDISRHRYKLLDQRNACFVTTRNNAERFLR